MYDINTNKILGSKVGVDTKGTHKPLSPRQQRFVELYYDANSISFGNCYQSAVRAGYSVMTARNLTHNKPAWLSEKVGQIKKLEPDDLLARLTRVIDDTNESTSNRLKAIDMMMKSSRMYSEVPSQLVQINIESILD